MPTRDFEIWLSDTVRIVVVFVTARGCVVKFVVRLVVKIKGIWYDVRRYDTAHGTPHIDVLNWRGDTLEKIWLAQLDPADALNFAIRDIADNHATYLQRFLV